MEDKLNKLPILKLKKASGKDTALKKRARYLLRREEVKNQKTRLECLLTQQFIHKYGSKTQQSKLNGAIILLIKQHLTNNDQMHSNTLAELELKIKQVTSAIKDEVRKKRNTIANRFYVFVLLDILNFFKIGIVYGLIVDAFKLGS